MKRPLAWLAIFGFTTASILAIVIFYPEWLDKILTWPKTFAAIITIGSIAGAISNLHKLRKIIWTDGTPESEKTLVKILSLLEEFITGLRMPKAEPLSSNNERVKPYPPFTIEPLVTNTGQPNVVDGPVDGRNLRYADRRYPVAFENEIRLSVRKITTGILIFFILTVVLYFTGPSFFFLIPLTACVMGLLAVLDIQLFRPPGEG